MFMLELFQIMKKMCINIMGVYHSLKRTFSSYLLFFLMPTAQLPCYRPIPIVQTH